MSNIPLPQAAYYAAALRRQHVLPKAVQAYRSRAEREAVQQGVEEGTVAILHPKRRHRRGLPAPVELPPAAIAPPPPEILDAVAGGIADFCDATNSLIDARFDLPARPKANWLRKIPYRERRILAAMRMLDRALEDFNTDIPSILNHIRRAEIALERLNRSQSK